MSISISGISLDYDYPEQTEVIKEHRVLTNISGIGPKTGARLIRDFGRLDEIRDTSVDELVTIQGVTHDRAEQLHEEIDKSQAGWTEDCPIQLEYHPDQNPPYTAVLGSKSDVGTTPSAAIATLVGRFTKQQFLDTIRDGTTERHHQ